MDRGKVVETVRALAQEYAQDLDRFKASAVCHGEHPDWPWNGVVLSAATLGGSWRWDKRVKPIYDAELSWGALDGLPAEERQERFNKVGRYWRRTAAFLEHMYEQLLKEGGPHVARSKLAAMTGPEILAFWSAFDGVGPKYARNIMMDVHHPSFRRGFFAIDLRIQKLLPVLGYKGSKQYGAMENFLSQLADETGVDGWDLDRLLYQRYDNVIAYLTTGGKKI